MQNNFMGCPILRITKKFNRAAGAAVNAVNVAFTMTVIGKLVLEKYKTKLNCPNMGIIALKTVFRSQKYAEILLNNIKIDPDEFLNSPQFINIARLEAIHI